MFVFISVVGSLSTTNAIYVSMLPRFFNGIFPS
nr:MAG TPA: hypothetical protein [Caudoviricetes sp.]